MSPGTTVERTARFLEGLSARSQLIDCPLRAYEVVVTKCSGAGECGAACMVNVFTTDADGRCEVANEELCFGCMACVYQCSEGGVSVVPRDSRRYPSVEDLLR
jgi:NAD-dependent dihydropyrimidine dehydrogenase PreA subunit